jgi:hypothetical protein
MRDSQAETLQDRARSSPAGVRESNQPGPIYDTATRWLAERDPGRLCRLLGIPVTERPQILPTEFSVGKLSVDLLLRIGPRELVHVEYTLRASADLVPRMMIYRGLIQRTYPKDHVSQHVLVLGDGWVRGHDDPDRYGFSLDLNIVYLRELAAGRFLDDPEFALFAALGRGGSKARAEAFAAAIRLIKEHGTDQVGKLLEFATVLATIRLDATTIKGIIEEAGVTVESDIMEEIFRDTGLARGLLRKGREELLVALLRERFGDHPDIPAITHSLAKWPDATSVAHAISTAATLDDLLTQRPAT